MALTGLALLTLAGTVLLWPFLGSDDPASPSLSADATNASASTAASEPATSGEAVDSTTEVSPSAPIQIAQSNDATPDAAQPLAAVFSSDQSGSVDIYRVDGETSSRLLARSTSDGSPSLSPDGTRLAFESSVGGIRAVFIGEVGGGEPIQISVSGAEATSPSWSPDGTRIAWVSLAGGSRNIGVYDVDSGEVMIVTSSSAHDRSPAWSPDSSALLFRSDRTGSGDIYRLELASGRLTQVTNSANEEDHPAEAQNGTVAFSRRIGSDWEIFTVIEGQQEQRITTNSGFDGYPIFAGDSLYFVSYESGATWIQGPDGTRYVESSGTIRDLHVMASPQ